MKKAIAAWAMLATVVASAADFPAGQYVTEGGWGTMVLKPGAGGKQDFSIESQGSNGHSCSIEGSISNGRAAVPTDPREPACKVGFVPRGAGIEVAVAAADAPACQYFCGMRAIFTGTYLPLPAACQPAPMEKRFQTAYRAKQYAQAHAVLDPFVRDCAKFTDWALLARFRNDLAITRYHLGDLAGCRAALAPISEFVKESDSALKEKYPPADAETALKIARASRFNWRQCGG